MQLSIFRRFAWPLAAVIVLTLAASAVLAEGSYKVLDRWKIGGDGGWDYLVADSAAHRLYITRADRVDAVDTNTGKIVGSIGGQKGNHGVALDPDGKVGYISDGSASTVVVFDRATFATLATIPVDNGPDGIVYEPVTKTVWTFNFSKTASIIDTVSRTKIATVQLPGKPEFPVADGKGIIYNNVESKNEIAKIDANTKKVIAEWPIKGCESPSGLAYDKEGQRLFAVCDEHKMGIIDTKTGETLGTAAIGDRPDAAAYVATDHLALASCGDGTLAVIDASKRDFPTIQQLATQSGARTMALDASTGRIYLVAAEMTAAGAQMMAGPPLGGGRPGGPGGPGPGGPDGPGLGGSGGPGGPDGFTPWVPGSFTVIVVGK